MTSTLCCAKCVTRMDWTLALLVVSFLGELVGTATVAVNYFIAAQTAREMQQWRSPERVPSINGTLLWRS
jgi:formate/nitrite transporter FocA (FNT family)